MLMLAVLCLCTSTAEVASIDVHMCNLTVCKSVNGVPLPCGKNISNSSPTAIAYNDLSGFACYQRIYEQGASSLFIECSSDFEESRIIPTYLQINLTIETNHVTVLSGLGERGTSADSIKGDVAPLSTCQWQSTCGLGAKAIVPINSGNSLEKSYSYSKLAVPAMAPYALNRQYANAHHVSADRGGAP